MIRKRITSVLFQIALWLRLVLKIRPKSLKVGSYEISNWSRFNPGGRCRNQGQNSARFDVTVSENGTEKQVSVTPEESQGRYILGVQPRLKSDIWSMFMGGFTTAADSALRILNALKA